MGLSNFISGWNRRSSCHRDLRKLGMNLIPFPRVSTHLSNAPNLSFTYLCQQLHFLMPSYAPFYDPRAVKYEKNSVPELTKAYVAPSLHLSDIHHSYPLQSFRPQKPPRSLRPSLWVSPPPYLEAPLTVRHLANISRYLTAATIFRGNISSREVSHAVMFPVRT